MTESNRFSNFQSASGGQVTAPKQGLVFRISKDTCFRPTRRLQRPGGALGNRKKQQRRKIRVTKQFKKVGKRMPYTVAQLLFLKPHYKDMPEGLKPLEGVFSEGLGQSFGVSDADTGHAPNRNVEAEPTKPQRRVIKTSGQMDILNQHMSGGQAGKGNKSKTPSAKPSVETSRASTTTSSPEKKAKAVAVKDPSHLNKPLTISKSGWTLNRNKDPMEKFKGRCRGILNKITVERFDTLSTQLVEFIQDEAKTEAQMNEIVSMLFQKTITEHKFGELYATLCCTLSKDCPTFSSLELGEKDEVREKTVTFQKILLNQCQKYFEQGHVPPVFTPDMDENDREIKRIQQKKKLIGTIIFIGQLFKVGLLKPGIIILCVKKMLHGTGAMGTTDEDLEMLCKLLDTVGPVLDKNKSLANANERNMMEKYWKQLGTKIKDLNFAQRTRMLIQNLLESRQRGFTGAAYEDNPQTIAELHKKFGNIAMPDSLEQPDAAREELLEATALANQEKDGGQEKRFRSQADRYARSRNILLFDQEPDAKVDSTGQRKKKRTRRNLLPSSALVVNVDTKAIKESVSSPAVGASGVVVQDFPSDEVESKFRDKMIDGYFEDEGKSFGKVKNIFSKGKFNVDKIVADLMQKALDRSEKEQRIAGDMLLNFINEGCFSSEQLASGLRYFLEYIESMWSFDVPKCPEYMATILHKLVTEQKIKLSIMFELLSADPGMDKVKKPDKMPFTQKAIFFSRLLSELKNLGCNVRDLAADLTLDVLVQDPNLHEQAIKDLKLGDFFK